MKEEKEISASEAMALSKKYLDNVKSLSNKKLGKIIHPNLDFNLTGNNTLGLANWIENTIYINIELLRKNPYELKDTVIHEYCHLLDKHVYDEFGHGKTWRKLMLNLGGNPSSKAFVKKDEKLIKEKEKRTYYLYLCDCKIEFFLTPAKHKEFLQKKIIYSCKKCKSILHFKMLTLK